MGYLPVATKMSECVPCDLSAGAAVLIKTYCKLPDEGCKKITKKFQEGNMTLRQLGEKVKADRRFMQFLAKETSIDLTLAQVLKKEKEV